MKRVDKIQSYIDKVSVLFFLYRINKDSKLLNDIIANIENLQTYIKWERVERNSF